MATIELVVKDSVEPVEGGESRRVTDLKAQLDGKLPELFGTNGESPEVTAAVRDALALLTYALESAKPDGVAQLFAARALTDPAVERPSQGEVPRQPRGVEFARELLEHYLARMGAEDRAALMAGALSVVAKYLGDTIVELQVNDPTRARSLAARAAGLSSAANV